MWFQADPNRVMDEMILRTSDHSRSSVHPLFALLTFPLCQVVAYIAGIPLVGAANVVMAIVAGLWCAALYGLMRALKCRMVGSALITCVGMVSAGALMFGGIPETYPLGSLSIILALWLGAIAERRPIGDRWLVVATALTFSITLTNGMVGLAVAFVHRAVKRALVIAAVAVCWIALVTLGVWSMLQSDWPLKRFSKLIVICLAGQLLLHVAYGSETFLYTLHFLPLLLCLCAFSFVGRLRKPAQVIALVLLLSCAINNAHAFRLSLWMADRVISAIQQHTKP